MIVSKIPFWIVSYFMQRIVIKIDDYVTSDSYNYMKIIMLLFSLIYCCLIPHGHTALNF